MTCVFAAEMGHNDIYTFKEMIQLEDSEKFIEAMNKEISVHTDRKHWEVMCKSDLPRDDNGKRAKTIMSIWSFKRKRDPFGVIEKYKARLCAHGGQQQWGVNYWETYAPVVEWMAVRLLLILAEIEGLETRSIDFILAFPQADLDVEVFMELPMGMDIDGNPDSHRTHCLRLKKSLYGLKQGSYNWFELLKTTLLSPEFNFAQSNVDPCVYFREDIILLSYVDDCILISRDSTVIDNVITALKKNFELTDDGTLQKYLGVEIVRNDDPEDKSFEMIQPFLIERICKFVGLDPRMTNANKTTPATKPLLHKDADGAPRKDTWNYRAAVGMLNYLASNTRPELSMAVHQCARFCNDPKLSHEKAVKQIARYLLRDPQRGIVYEPDPARGIECFVDADFAGGWSRADAESAENVMSRTGFVIMYAGCPIIWISKLQTEIALSTAEAEYIALSQAMRQVIPCMNLLIEISCVIDIPMPKPEVHCKVFEDNRSAITIAEANKFTPRTKHIALKYHHFRSYVKSKAIQIFPIDTKEQTADIFTKPLDEQPFLYLRKKLNGW